MSNLVPPSDILLGATVKHDPNSKMNYTPDHLGHANIYVRNAEQSQKWYEDILGLHTCSFTPGRAAFMSANLDESHEVPLMEVG